MKKQNYGVQLVLFFTMIHLMGVPVSTVFAVTGEPELSQALGEEHLLEEFAAFIQPKAAIQFKQSNFTGVVGQPVMLEIASDLAVDEVSVNLPANVSVKTEVLIPNQTFVKQDQHSWQVKTSQKQQHFTVPIVAEEVGTYTVSSGEVEAVVDIVDTDTPEETSEESSKELGKTDMLEAHETGNLEGEQAKNDMESQQETVGIAAASDGVSRSFDGATVEVNTMAEFISALQDPAVSIISLGSDLSTSASNIMEINRSIKIQGNGHTLTLNNNNAYFRLTAVNEETIFRLENLKYQKTGNLALINTTNALSRGWVVEVEDVEEITANRSPFILAREAKVHFTGGTNRFEAMTMDSDTLFNLRAVEASNQTQVIINKPNMWIFYTAPDINDPSLLIDGDAQVTITAQQGDANTIDLRGENGKVTLNHGGSLSIQSPGAATNATNDNNNAVILSGNNPAFIAGENTRFSIDTTQRKRGLVLVGEAPEVTINGNSHVSITTVNANAILLNGQRPYLTITGEKTELQVNNEIATNANAIDLRGADGHLSIFDEASVIVRSQGTDTEATNDQNNAVAMNGANPTMVVGDASLLLIETTQRKRGIFINGDNPQLTVHSGTTAKLTAKNAMALRINGKNADVTIRGENTHVTIMSEIAAGEGAASFVLSTPAVAAEAGVLMVSESAVLEVESVSSSAINITSLGFTFEVQSNGKLITSSQYADGDHATIRFLYYGLVTFHVTEGGSVDIFKSGGSAPLIRIPSGGNSFEISEGGSVDLYNPGNGVAHDGDAAGGNQGIYYARGVNDNGTENNFSIIGVDSKFKCVAKSGPGIDMHTYFQSNIYVEQGYFQVDGNTRTPNGGVFRSGKLTVQLNDPVFFDFRNDRIDGGNLFYVDNTSTLTATNSDLAVWKNGSNLCGDPDLNFPTLDFTFSGFDFDTLISTNKPEVLNEETFGVNGLTDYSRVSSNNARWAIADDLRVPTNADRKIHGRVSLPVGLDGTRPAWDDEAKVTVEIKTPDGKTERITAKTVGHSEENPGISIYGEEAQGGIFEISLAAPLEAGSTIRIVEVVLTSGELTEGAEHQILTSAVTVFPIIPPTPAVFSAYFLPEATTEIHGYTEDRQVELSATHNGEWLNTDTVVIDETGRFTIDVSDRQLNTGDEIQVFLKDYAGSAKAAGVKQPPSTNDEQGNQNPPSELSFRDAVFPAATTLKILKTGPLPPVDPIEPDVEATPENPPVIPENQGLLSLDFVSQFQFGQAPIRSGEGTYHALPQQIDRDEGATGTRERPNYVQVTDQRNSQEETSWRLSATLDAQGFRNEENDYLIGAQIHLANQQLVTTSANTDASMPELSTAEETVTLRPGEAQPLLIGSSDSVGTWVYRFGDLETAATSVTLEVPAGANPKLGRYSASIEWSLSSVPE